MYPLKAPLDTSVFPQSRVVYSGSIWEAEATEEADYGPQLVLADRGPVATESDGAMEAASGVSDRPLLRRCELGCDERALTCELQADARHSALCPRVQSHIGANVYTPQQQSKDDSLGAKRNALAERLQALQNSPALCGYLFAARHVHVMRA